MFLTACVARAWGRREAQKWAKDVGSLNREISQIGLLNVGLRG
jgi:hypothetical protein